MPEATIDRTTFENLQATAGADFVRELVDTFLVEAPRMLDELNASLAAGDAERFRRVAHSLKSNGNTFGALTLGAMAKKLELGGFAVAREANGAALSQIASEYTRVADALEELKRA
jgi:HPt (histidine-containing phosphotransfer) domain-containing protein